MTFPNKVMNKLTEKFGEKSLSPQTEKAYYYWIKRFIEFHENLNTEKELRENPLEKTQPFIDYLFINEASVSTQKQALYAIRFFYTEVLEEDFSLSDVAVNKNGNGGTEKLPEILSRHKIMSILKEMKGKYWLMASLLYGAGLCLMECINLRVRNIDFDKKKIIITDDEGKEKHTTILPYQVEIPLKRHIKKLNLTFEEDLFEDFGGVFLPKKVEEKNPELKMEWEWQYVFPARRRVVDEGIGKEMRTKISATSLQRAIKKATKAAGIEENASPQIFRNSFAAHLLEKGYKVEDVQKLLGHKDVRTTMVYLKILDKPREIIKSPLDY